MKTTLKNTLALVIGLLIGGVANMALIILGGMVVTPPPGVDVSDMESLKAGIHLFEFKHFIFPWLAHAVGTLVGAMVAIKLAVSHKYKLALGVGVFFLAGGIANVMILPSPLWFNIVDLTLAYIPMGWLAYKLSKKNQTPIN